MEKKDNVISFTMEEPKEYPKKIRTCTGSPCKICQHESCGSCPDCSPEVPDWTT